MVNPILHLSISAILLDSGIRTTITPTTRTTTATATCSCHSGSD